MDATVAPASSEAPGAKGVPPPVSDPLASPPAVGAGTDNPTLSGSASAGSSATTKPRPAAGLTLGELYLLTRPATWDPEEDANNARKRGGRGRSGSVSEGSEGRPGGSRGRGGARSTRRKNRTPYYVAQSEDEEDEADGGDADYYARNGQWNANAAQPARRGGAASAVPRGAATTTATRGVRFKCTYPGCEKSFTREGDRARHLATTLHRGEMLSAARIAEIMAETRETHRQYCVRCKRIMLRVNSRRRHEENPGACGSRRGMPKDVIEGGRVEQPVQ